MTSISIAVEPGYRYDLALAYLSRSDDEILDIVREMRHRRLLPTKPSPSLVEVRGPEAEAQPSLTARVLDGPATENDLRALIEQIYQPGKTINSSPPEESLGASLHSNFSGLPVVQSLTPWEALVWAVIGQQINIAFAYRLKRAFVERVGPSLAYEGLTYYGFPEPEQVAGLDHERDLRPLQFSRQKSRYIVAAARSIVTGDLDLDAIDQLDDDSASQALQRQLGIGRWTAEYILLRGFGRLNVIPAGDAALRAGVGAHLRLGRSATEDEVRDFALQWVPRRGQTAFMLWFARQRGLLTF